MLDPALVAHRMLQKIQLCASGLVRLDLGTHKVRQNAVKTVWVSWAPLTIIKTSTEATMRLSR